MATKNFKIIKWTEQEIEEVMADKGIPGYSERYYTSKREVDTTCGKKAWAVDVKEYYG